MHKHQNYKYNGPYTYLVGILSFCVSIFLNILKFHSWDMSVALLGVVIYSGFQSAGILGWIDYKFVDIYWCFLIFLPRDHFFYSFIFNLPTFVFDRIPQIECSELMRDGVNCLADLMMDTLPLPGDRPGWVMNFVKRCSFYHSEATDSLPQVPVLPSVFSS